MKNRNAAYWWCQLGGWSAYITVYIFFYLTISTKDFPYFYHVLTLDATVGFLMTHTMRMLYKTTRLLSLAIRQQIVYVVLATLFFAFAWAFIVVSVESTFHWETRQMEELSIINKTIRTSLGQFLFLAIWNLIYFAYHFVMKSRQEQLGRMRLQSMVKELELKTIKAHINPHFIFNALNSIRALVDENPGRARTAITELSNILRSSMQAEKAETTPLERELNIVKDYLALEHIRFEDRLQVEYDIDEDTLDQPVPPMMLQTLVENAIKHGISKQVDGGTIRIISDFRDNHHELIVQNTGRLNGSYNHEGFGLASTQNRLKLLYGSKASFQINDKNGNIVEAKVVMPVGHY
ncbi:MAG TPA: histidine kinase [Chitinophagaceae bacterium]